MQLLSIRTAELVVKTGSAAHCFGWEPHGSPSIRFLPLSTTACFPQPCRAKLHFL